MLTCIWWVCSRIDTVTTCNSVVEDWCKTNNIKLLTFHSFINTCDKFMLINSRAFYTGLIAIWWESKLKALSTHCIHRESDKSAECWLSGWDWVQFIPARKVVRVHANGGHLLCLWTTEHWWRVTWMTLQLSAVVPSSINVNEFNISSFCGYKLCSWFTFRDTAICTLVCPNSLHADAPSYEWVRQFGWSWFLRGL